MSSPSGPTVPTERYDEIHREWESACERADYSQSQADAARDALRNLLDALDATLPTAWQWGPSVSSALDRARRVVGNSKGGG